MLITNTTNQDYWFGPLHIAASAVNFSVDDTTATSLYLTDDDVADAINYLYQQGKITVSGAATPFPRPTGSPEIQHGLGNPEGLSYATQGSVYLRQDKPAVYLKTTAKTLNTGWKLWNADANGALVTQVKAGTPADADLDNPQSGNIVVDTTAGKIWVRVGSTWKYATLT